MGEGGEDGRRGARALAAAPSGSGRRRSSTAIQASAPFPTRSTRRPSSATSTGCCAAARGSLIRSSPGPRSATGICRSGGRSSPASAARAMSRALTDGQSLGARTRRRAGACSAEPKELPAVWLYDERGSQLYERDHAAAGVLPATRAKREILRARAAGIASARRRARSSSSARGTPKNTRLLLDALGRWHARALRSARRQRADACARARSAIADAYPRVSVEPIVGDFERDLGRAPGGGRRLIAFLGSTIGNLYPEQPVASLLATLAGSARARRRAPASASTSSRTSPACEAAYNDRSGVTEAFVRNALTAVNRELERDVRPAALRLRGALGSEHEWMDIGLRAREAHAVSIRRLGLDARRSSGGAAPGRDQLEVPPRELSNT